MGEKKKGSLLQRRTTSCNVEYVRKKTRSKPWRPLVPVMALSSFLTGSVSRDGAIRKEIREICNQVFSPDYSLPPVRGHDTMAIDIRQGWRHNTDLHDSHLLALASAEHQLLQTEYEDYAVTQTSSIACLRSVALILVLVLLVRQAIMATTLQLGKNYQ